MTIKALALATGLSLAALPALADEIRVLNWQGYGTDLDWAVNAFEDQTGYKVVNDYFTSEQEMLTKLRTNPGAYDVVLVNAAFSPQAQESNLLAPIDTAKIANYAGIPAKFAESKSLVSDGKVYGVPWTWGVTGMAVNSDAVDPVPQSLSALWDPEEKGMVTIRDDAVEAIQLGALATGQDINDIKDMDAVKAKLASLMPQIRTFWSSENDWNQYMASGQIELGTYWSGSAARSVSMGLPVQFVVPKEGAIGWLDSLAIPAASTHKDIAAKFINWMLDPAFYTRWNKDGAPVSANAKADSALPDDAFNKKVLGDPAVLDRVQFQAPITDDQRKQYLKIWQELKAAQ